MNNLVKYGLIALVIGVVYYSSNSDSPSYAGADIDLNAVLDVTVDTIYTYEEAVKTQEEPNADDAFIGFSEELALNYNKAQPALHDKAIGVSPQTDASLLAFEDLNANKAMDEGESALFLIEVDGENSRVIASSNNGAVNDHHFSGTSLLAGYLIGSMLTRQRAAGVNSKNLANKQTKTAAQAARSRAGSGSHSRGK